jgi:hypothetical protein
VGIRLHSYRNCPLDVWRFSLTRQYLICHRSGRLGDRVGYTLDFKLTHYPTRTVSYDLHQEPTPLLDKVARLKIIRKGHTAERSARNSESEVNSNRSASLGRQGRLDYVNFGTLCSPHLSRCPKFFFPDRLDTLQLPAEDLFFT